MNPLPDIALHTLGRAPSPGLPPDVDIIINSLTDNLGGREWARQEYSAMISYRNRRVLNRKELCYFLKEPFFLIFFA